MVTGESQQDRLAQLARGWQAAEDKLYPLVMVRPDSYQVAVTWVRAVVDRLHDVRTAEALADAYEDAAELVADVVRDVGMAAEGIDLGLVAGAAFNMRYREVRAAADREQAKERIRAAATSGDAWVILFESGRRELAPLTPYRRLEMRLSDGYGLHASITTDPSSGRAVYTVETVQLDPATGDWLHDAPSAAPTMYDTEAEWVAAIARLRH